MNVLNCRNQQSSKSRNNILTNKDCNERNNNNYYSFNRGRNIVNPYKKRIDSASTNILTNSSSINSQDSSVNNNNFSGKSIARDDDDSVSTSKVSNCSGYSTNIVNPYKKTNSNSTGSNNEKKYFKKDYINVATKKDSVNSTKEWWSNHQARKKAAAYHPTI